MPKVTQDCFRAAAVFPDSESGPTSCGPLHCQSKFQILHFRPAVISVAVASPSAASFALTSRARQCGRPLQSLEHHHAACATFMVLEGTFCDAEACGSRVVREGPGEHARGGQRHGPRRQAGGRRTADSTSSQMVFLPEKLNSRSQDDGVLSRVDCMEVDGAARCGASSSTQRAHVLGTHLCKRGRCPPCRARGHPKTSNHSSCKIRRGRLLVRCSASSVAVEVVGDCRGARHLFVPTNQH